MTEKKPGGKAALRAGKQYRDQQNAKARANRQRKLKAAAERVVQDEKP